MIRTTRSRPERLQHSAEDKAPDRSGLGFNIHIALSVDRHVRACTARSIHTFNHL